ncbi:MAG: hypothetical protein KDA98_16550, partial [Acidimicrobiales bacterium]|nr:hypothetical protein [Acidimicrobiales bacterium]
LAIAYLASRGIGPDRTLGVARGVRVRSIRASHDGDAGTTVISVSGVHVLHAAVGDDEAAFATWADGRPVEVPVAGHPGVRVEVLDWGAIAEAIWPENHRPVPVPSPFPYLPSSPQELLGAYLEVVGIHPAHCYAASVVEDQPRSIDGVRVAAGGLIQTRTNLGTAQPCADGKDRRRLVGGVHVVVAHLDAPAYVEGRERWDRYQREVLQANLAAETGARRPVHDASWSELPPGLRGLVRGAEALDRLTDVFDAEWNGRFAPHRYCWPASG